MALPQFIFGGNTGIKSPEDLARARMLAEALLGPQRPAHDVGEGLAVLGQAIRGRREMNAVNQASAAGQESAQSAIAKALGGAGAFPAAPGGGASPSAAGNGSLPAVDVSKTASGSVDPQAIYAGLKARGLNDAQAFATLGNWKQESEFRPGAINPGEGAIGFTQWREGRKNSLENFAKATGRSANDPETQMDFYVREAGIVPDTTGTVRVDPGGSEFAKATDVQGANRALKGFIRYGSPYDKGGEGTRLANALAYQKRFGSPAGVAAALASVPQPQQVASLDPSVGMPPAPSPVATALQLPQQAPAPQARPDIAAALNGPQQGPVPGAPAAVTPAGQRVVQQMVGKQPIGGQFQGIEPSLRPFNPGERRPNPDGSYSTEISTTQQQPDGQFVNTPSLWMGRQGSVQFNPNDEQGIMSEAQRFENQNGPTFARFPNVQAAEQAAIARSAAGGAGAGAPIVAPQQAPDNLPVMAGGNADAVQKGQLPSIQDLMQAAQNPWLNEEQRGVVNMLLKRQMDAQDPNNALDAEYKRAQIDALKAKPDQTPEAVRALQIRADQAGLKPGTKEYQDFMLTGGAPKAETKPAGIQEYEYAKSQGFPGTFQDWEASKKGGMSLSVDPETGAVSFQQGGNIKPMTEAQSKDTTFATRAAGALPLVDKFGDALTSLSQSAGGQVPLIGNYMKTPEYQQAEQAGKEFLQAILRKDTGAAITAGETAEYGSVYLPRPGDSPELLAQKKASRTRALEALKAGMTPQAILAQEKAVAASGGVPTAPSEPKKRLKFNPATGELE